MSEEPRETPFGGLEPDDVTSSEYKRAVESLKDFAEIDVSKIRNIEDLSAKASLIGEDIRRIVLASGEIQVTKFDYQDSTNRETRKAVDRAWVVRKPLDEYTVFTTFGDTNAHIETYKTIGGEQTSVYSVNLPVSGNIGVKGEPISDSSSIYAVDWRGKQVESYYPAREPENSEVQQSFARVLKDAVNDLLSVTPPATELPSSFK